LRKCGDAEKIQDEALYGRVLSVLVTPRILLDHRVIVRVGVSTENVDKRGIQMKVN
jgi:hypothetical protein